VSLHLLRIGILLACLAPAAQPQAPTFFITGSDPQFGMYAENKNFIQETANFEFFIANVNRLKPQFVVITGDLINIQHNAEQTAEYQRILKLLDKSITLYSVPGNHDVSNTPTPADLELYRKDIGPDYYSFRSPGIYGIVIDSSLLAHPETAEAEAAKHEAWLHAELKKASAETGRQIVIFQHIPFFIENPYEADQYFNFPKPVREKYLKLLHEHHVKYVFAGHTHRNYNPRDVELEEVITTAIGKPLGPEPSGFRIVGIKGNRLEHTYVSLGSIPNTYPPAK
jgi:serine/threonine-protein phosphatase CPPED1